MLIQGLRCIEIAMAQITLPKAPIIGLACGLVHGRVFRVPLELLFSNSTMRVEPADHAVDSRAVHLRRIGASAPFEMMGSTTCCHKALLTEGTADLLAAVGPRVHVLELWISGRQLHLSFCSLAARKLWALLK